MLLCLHHDPGFFAARHLGLGMRLSLLASQAFQNEEERQSTLESSKLAAIGEMAAGIVHEINQPLTALMLGLTNVKQAVKQGSWDQDRVLDRLGRLEGQTQRIAKIIASMKALAHRSDGAIEPFSLHTAALDALAIIEHKLALALVETRIDIPPELEVYGDAGECAQVILNLFSNALDAIEAQARPDDSADGAAGRISVTASVLDDGWAELEFRDTGGGFPPDGMEKALLPFYTTKPNGKGTGLGLALCRRIIENMGGSITLANWEEGALVRLRLRRSAPED